VFSRKYDASVDFYVKVLGLRQRVEFVHEGKRVSLLDMGSKGDYIEVFEAADKATDTDGRWAHIALRCDDVAGVLARVKALGHVVTMEAKTIELDTNAGPKPFVIHIGFFRGPDGELIELFEEKTPVRLD
jgi:catechol 2,3-dioxygenase-like lactoylglutathione lyase family enzyme